MRYGGRTKGIKNKPKESFRDTLDRLKFSVPEEAKKLYESISLDPAMIGHKIECLKIIAVHSHPKFKEVEVAATNTIETNPAIQANRDAFFQVLRPEVVNAQANA